MNNCFYYILSVCCVFTFQVNAQILDDSTKQVYGYHSTKYFTEKEIFKDDTTKFSPDSSFDATIQRYEKLYFKDNIYQNLGNLGTASKAIFWEQPTAIGYTFGYHTYDQYASNVLKTNYFDAKSPFTSLKYIQGGTGENALDFDFTRNFSKLLNVGMHVHRLTSVKQIGRKVQRDRNVDQWDFGFNTSFHTANNRYTALATYARFSTLVRENGGIRPDSVQFNQTELDAYDESPVKMSDSAMTMDDRTNFRFYHQLGILPNKVVSIFHSFSYQNQYVGFNDRSLNNTSAGITMFTDFVYPDYFIDSTRTVYRANYNSKVNTIGLKSDLNKLKLRTYSIFENNKYKQIIKSDSLDKLFITVVKAGAEADFYFNNNAKIEFTAIQQVSLTAKAEKTMNQLNVVNNKDYNLNISFVNQFFKAGYSQARYSPTLQQIQYASNSYAWQNNAFKPIETQTYYAKIFKTVQRQRFEFALTHTEVNNYVYYLDTAKLDNHWREQIIVKQDRAKGFNITSFDVFADFNIGNKFFINNQVRYSMSAGDVNYRSYRVPTVYASSLIYYQLRFKKDLGLQIGVDIHHRSAYKADAYSVALQQFVVQNNFVAKAYTVVDAFINLKVKSATVWVKGSQINQYFGPQVYFVTPYYPGMKMAFHFGVNWPFFN